MKMASGQLLRVKTVDIGGWDMDLYDYAQVFHGLASIDKLLAVTGWIQRNDGALRMSIPCSIENTGDHVEVWIGYWDADTVIVYRRPGGGFDSINYSGVAINRGQLLLFYIE